MQRASLAVGGALAVSLFWPLPAGACGSCTCHDQPPERWLFPTRPTGSELATWVPRNPRLLLATPASGVALRSEQGVMVQLDLESAGIEGLSWARPQVLLEAGQTYELVPAADDDAGTADAGPLWFMVADRVDDISAGIGLVRIEPATGASTCALGVGAALSIAAIFETDDPGGTVYVQLDLRMGKATQRVITPFRSWGLEQSAEFGLAPQSPTCLLGRTVPGAVADEPVTAEITLYDLAGNATMMEPVTFHFAHVQGSGCPSSLGAPPREPDLAPDGGGFDATRDDRSDSTSSSQADGGCAVVGPSSARSTGGWLMGLLIAARLRRRPARAAAQRT